MPLSLGTPADVPEMAALWTARRLAFIAEWPTPVAPVEYDEARLVSLMARPGERFPVYRTPGGVLRGWVHMSGRTFVIGVLDAALGAAEHRLRLREMMREIASQLPADLVMRGGVKAGSAYDALFSSRAFLQRRLSDDGVYAYFRGRAGDIAVAL